MAGGSKKKQKKSPNGIATLARRWGMPPPEGEEVGLSACCCCMLTRLPTDGLMAYALCKAASMRVVPGRAGALLEEGNRRRCGAAHHTIFQLAPSPRRHRRPRQHRPRSHSLRSVSQRQSALLFFFFLSARTFIIFSCCTQTHRKGPSSAAPCPVTWCERWDFADHLASSPPSLHPSLARVCACAHVAAAACRSFSYWRAFLLVGARVKYTLLYY